MSAQDAAIPGEVLARLRDARGFIFDMDGTLALGDRVNHGLTPLPGAVEMLAWTRDRGLPYLVFTNGTNRSPAHFAAVLREAGLDVPDDAMMTPASSAVVMFTKRGYKRVMVLGGDGLTEPLRAAGIEVVPPVALSAAGRLGDRGPAAVDAVLVGWFREFTLAHLEAACDAVLVRRRAVLGVADPVLRDCRRPGARHVPRDLRDDHLDHRLPPDHNGKAVA